MQIVFKNILVVSAHPDDIEYSCAGFLLKQQSMGSNIYLLVLTNGESGDTAKSIDILAKERLNEQKKSIKLSKFNLIKSPALIDGKIAFNSETVKLIETKIATIKPDLILTHFPEDTHQDHINTSKAVLSAARNCLNIWYFKSYSSINFVPNIYIDIEDFIEQKIVLLDCHITQIQKYLASSIDFKKHMLISSEFYGLKIKKKAAEPFYIFSMSS